MPGSVDDYLRFLAEDRKNDSADLAANKRANFVLDVVDEGEEVTIVAVTGAEEGRPSRLWNRPKGVARQGLATTTLHKGEWYELYSVTMRKADLPAGSRFFLKQGGAWERTLNPYASNIALPEGWGLSPYHLFLTYGAPPEAGPEVRRHRAFARTVTNEKGKLVVSGVIIANYELDAPVFVIRKFRDEAVNWPFPVTIKGAGRVWGVSGKSYRAYRGEYAYKFSVECDLPWRQMVSSIYSALIETPDHKSGLHAFNKTIFQKSGLIEFKSRLLYSYIDVVASNIRFELFSISKRVAFEALEEIAEKKPRAPICLVGEYTNAARDNGLRLFEAMRRERTIEAWYVIEDGCELAGDRVLTFGSRSHFIKSVQASVVAFSHHPNYVLPELVNTFRRERARTIFLQHGVTALKNSMPAYHSSRRLFDAFVVSSRSEAESVETACAYPPENVVVTGMPRLDRLFKLARQNRGGRKDIVVFPTWRRGLDKVTQDEFLATEFFIAWSRAMAALRAAGRASGHRLVLISHPIIERHIGAFENTVDAIVDAESLQETLVGAACLITDYSSVAFDAAYIDVPVIFFTFDDVDYGFAEGAFIDVETELPGTRFRSVEELEAGVANLAECLTEAAAAAAAIRHRYFKYVDAGNSRRVISTIKSLAEQAHDAARA